MELNHRESAYLLKYYKGDQPILKREKEYRSEITNRIVQNHAYEIASFKTGYVFGDPIQYVRIGAVSQERPGAKTDPEDPDATRVSESIAQLNRYMVDEDKATVDKSIALMMAITGVGYRLTLPDKYADEEEDEAPFELESLDPANAFVVYYGGVGRRPLIGGYRTLMDSGEERWACWTRDTYFLLDNEFEVIPGHTASHAIGDVPIIEYLYGEERMGAFEPVIPLLDAINNLTSNRVDDVEQFVQSLLKFFNCAIVETSFSWLRELGALSVTSIEGIPADVQIMSQSLDQSQMQSFVDICTIPCSSSRRCPTATGGKGRGDTGQVMLRDGWSAGERGEGR